jgi:hypothetical protein
MRDLTDEMSERLLRLFCAIEREAKMIFERYSDCKHPRFIGDAYEKMVRKFLVETFCQTDLAVYANSYIEAFRGDRGRLTEFDCVLAHGAGLPVDILGGKHGCVLRADSVVAVVEITSNRDPAKFEADLKKMATFKETVENNTPESFAVSVDEPKLPALMANASRGGLESNVVSEVARGIMYSSGLLRNVLCRFRLQMQQSYAGGTKDGSQVGATTGEARRGRLGGFAKRRADERDRAALSGERGDALARA